MRVASAVAVLAAGGFALSACSSSGSSPARAPLGGANSGGASIGQTVAPEPSAKAVSAADLGKPITQGSLTITVSGPVTTSKNANELLVTLHATMTNTAKSGDVIGPDWFGVRCDANRDSRRPGDQMSSTTVPQDKHIAAGQTVSGVVVDAWLKWNSIDKCTGVTTVEARFLSGGFLSWTIPADVVARVNAAGGAS